MAAARPADLCSDLLLLGLRIVTGSADLPPCESLRRSVLEELARVAAAAEGGGCTAADVDDMRYAVCAYLDEMVQFSQWPGREQWTARPLQVELYGEQLAGIKFFERLQLVRQRSAAVLEVYYQCLVLGFHGRHRMGQLEELHALIAEVRTEVAPTRPGKLSVHGLRRAAALSRGRGVPLALLGGAVALLSIVAAGVLYLALSDYRGEAVTMLVNWGAR